MNSVVLVGRMTKDPELKYTNSGKANTRFTLAVQRNKNEADFINCVAWEKNAENIAEYFRKGNQIGVQGRLTVRSYQQNGENKWIAEVVVEKFDFINSKNSSNDGNYSNNNDSFSNSNNSQPQHSSSNSFADTNDGDSSYESDEDFPF